MSLISLMRINPLYESLGIRNIKELAWMSLEMAHANKKY